ncbi:MAG: hypothetical protein HY898_27400 [Deltaproteobacteria bacterium]|nr:hypothetical protein [Deltaproteobacteria bacterium]
MLLRILPLLLMLPLGCNVDKDRACASNNDCGGGRICVNSRCRDGVAPAASAPGGTSAPSPAPSSSASAPVDPKEPTPVLGDFCFSGTIGDQSVSGALKAFGDRVSGEYYQAKTGSGTRRRLTGTRAGSTVKLKEQANDGTVAGTFEGAVTGGGRYTGTWSSSSGSRKMPFDLGPTVCGPEYW